MSTQIDEDNDHRRRLNKIESWLITEPQLTWKDRGITIGVGVFFVLLSIVLGAVLEQSFQTVDLSSELFTALHLAFVGLGTGHYLGLSLKGAETSRRWFFFGAFLTLFAYSFFTISSWIQGIVPIQSLLVLGAGGSILFHLSPLVDENDDFRRYMNFFSAHLSRAAIVVFAVSNYLLKSVQLMYIEWLSLNLTMKVIAFFAVLGGIVALHQFYETTLEHLRESRNNR